MDPDRSAFTQSLQDPAHEIPQKLERLLQSLDPAYKEATLFLNNLSNVSAKHTTKLETICEESATEAVETLAEGVSDLIHSSYQVALKICNTKVISLDHNHYNPRAISNKRRNLKKKLSLIRSIQSQLTSPAINKSDKISTILHLIRRNPALDKTISNSMA